jgi:hypothetical protein
MEFIDDWRDRVFGIRSPKKFSSFCIFLRGTGAAEASLANGSDVATGVWPGFRLRINRGTDPVSSGPSSASNARISVALMGRAVGSAA